MIGDRLEKMSMMGATYQAIESNGGCSGCVFYPLDHNCSFNLISCTRKGREDGREVIWKITPNVKKSVEVGIQSDGFVIRTKDKTFHFSQEESNEEEFKKLFEHLGFDVTVAEEY